MSRRRIAKMWREPLTHHLVFRRGLISDDTEHICLLAQTLIASGGDVERFERDLRRRLRWWLAALPAGVGLATLRAIVRMWLGFANPGVASAGNGPAMRAAIVGATVEDLERLIQLTERHSKLTHSDQRAVHGAMTVALAARLARNGQHDGASLVAACQQSFGKQNSELLPVLLAAKDSIDKGQSTREFADELGLSSGVSGFVMETLPVAIHAWLAHPRDYRKAVTAIIRCGGDTDSAAAITGAIVGSAVGVEGIPADWRNGLIEWPRSQAWMSVLAEQLARARLNEELPVQSTPTGVNPIALVMRNLAFVLVVLTHGLRRLLPPY